MVAADVDVVSHLAHHAAGTSYDALPPPAVDAAKKSILDTLGCHSGGERNGARRPRCHRLGPGDRR